jgi:hypothetical protein
MGKVVKEQVPHPGPAEGWNPYDEYDCRENEPKQTQAYIDEVWPAGVKEAIAKRQAELMAAPIPTVPEHAESKKQ